MANYANQKRVDLDAQQIELVKHNRNDKTDGYYPPLEYVYVDKAASLLNGNAFKLWLYLIRWHNQGYVFFSPAAIENAMGMKKSSISDSWKELENKGFIQSTDKGNRYIFTPISNKLV